MLLQERTEWILYRDGEVITTITEDELDTMDPLQGGGTSLTDPIAAARAENYVRISKFKWGGLTGYLSPEEIDSSRLAEAMEREDKASYVAAEQTTPIEVRVAVEIINSWVKDLAEIQGRSCSGETKSSLDPYQVILPP
eukprot:763570-Hanusia_phi.AAC.2